MKRRLVTLLMALVATPQIGVADDERLIVVYDSGATVPIAPYLTVIDPAVSARPKASVAVPSAAESASALLLPVESPALSPGLVKSRALSGPVPVALFVIGADPASLRWLRRHRARLVVAGAQGLLISARSATDIERVATLARGLAITPVPGDALARLFQVRHYPFAVTEGRLWQ